MVIKYIVETRLLVINHHYYHPVDGVFYSNNTVESLYYGHPRDHMKCPDQRGVLISEVV